MIPRITVFLRSSIILISIVIISACTTKYDGTDFSFYAPAGYKTTVYETAEIDTGKDSQPLLFSQRRSAGIYFEVFRQKIDPKSNLDSIFADHMARIVDRYNSLHFQFISQKMIIINNYSGIEFVHREFSGEPYLQTREIWIENNGWAYSLVCVVHADSTPGLEIPISDECIHLAESFQFK